MSFQPLQLNVSVTLMPIVRFTKFALIDRITLLNIVKRVKKTYCSMDPLHISVLVCAEKFSDFVDVVLIVVNASVVSCKFLCNPNAYCALYKVCSD